MEELTSLVKDDGYSAVRFNPYLWPDGENMINARGRAMYKRCTVRMSSCLLLWVLRIQLQATFWHSARLQHVACSTSPAALSRAPGLFN